MSRCTIIRIKKNNNSCLRPDSKTTALIDAINLVEHAKFAPSASSESEVKPSSSRVADSVVGVKDVGSHYVGFHIVRDGNKCVEQLKVRPVREVVLIRAST